MSNNFNILDPQQDQKCETDGFEQVMVRITNDDINNDSFWAAVVDLTDDPDSLVELRREGNTRRWSGAVECAPPDVPDTQGPNNRKIVVHAFEGENGPFEKNLTFNASHGEPAGSSGPAPRPPIFSHFIKTGNVIPRALALKVDAKVTKGTCAKCAELNQPTLLLHTIDAKKNGAWFSKPIAIGGKDESAAFWVLNKTSNTTWTLVLRQGKSAIATYTAKTEPKEASFPVKLLRKGAGSKVCKNWPKSITVAALK